jgi:bacteriorhodopsin
VVGIRVFTNWFIYAIGKVIRKKMIDYSELKLNIQKLNEQTFSYLNMRNVEAAQQTVEKLEMSTMMLKKYIDWVVQNK